MNRQSLVKATLFAATLLLVATAPSRGASPSSADTAHLLTGRVVLLNVFVNDQGQTQWNEPDRTTRYEKATQAMDHLEALAAATGIPLSIETYRLEVWTAMDVSHSSGEAEEQAWIRDAFGRTTGAFANDDGDEYASDEVMFWVQALYGRDRSTDAPRPPAVVLAFHFLFEGEAGTIGEGEQDDKGNYFRIPRPAGRCNSDFDYDWKAYAHEFLHAFGARDEYGSCCCHCENQYLFYSYRPQSVNGETNANHQDCSDALNSHCLMLSCAPDAELCQYTRRQIGWGDWDLDGEPDAVDFGDVLEARILNSGRDFSEGTGPLAYSVTHSSGGGLQTVNLVSNVSDWDVHGPLPLPFFDETFLFAAQGHLFCKGSRYADNGNVGYTDDIYSAPFAGDGIGSWKIAGTYPYGAWPEDYVPAYGRLYVYGDFPAPHESRLGVADVRSNGTLGAWLELPSPPPPLNEGQLAVANGFLFLFWIDSSQTSLFSWARLTPHGTVQAWNDALLAPARAMDVASYDNTLYLTEKLVEGASATRVWYVRINDDGSPGQWTEGLSVPGVVLPGDPRGERCVFGSRLVAGAGTLLSVGGAVGTGGSSAVEVDRIMRCTIQTDGSTGPWLEIGSLPFAAAEPGVCITADERLRLWTGGGGRGPSSSANNDWYVSDLEIASGWYPSVRSRMAYLLNCGTDKNLYSIAWRSTSPDNVLLRYRHAIAGGNFSTWQAERFETDGRITFGDPYRNSGMAAAALEIELITEPGVEARIHDVMVAYTDPNPGVTPAGSQVLATLPSGVGQCRFEAVTAAGLTTAIPALSPLTPPPGLTMRSAFELATTALFQGLVYIGISYDPLSVLSTATLRLFHDAGGAWEDMTSFVDPIGRKVWGRAASFSTFAVMEDTTQVPVDTPEISALVPHFSVRQNFPNPFNPVTTISYMLPMAQRVTIQVFDLRGRLVRTLLRELRPEGDGTVTWDGTDDHGRPVASGLYVYQLRTDTFEASKKMALVR